VTQRLYESLVSLTAAGERLNPIVCRYAWPSELDLMARIAGLRLKDRRAGWLREPFNAASRAHVSVYGRWRPAREALSVIGNGGTARPRPHDHP
jgi:hypothetical protein